MLTAMIAMGLLAATAVAGSVVQFRRDGYRRTPTFSR
jgi:hypothetical protein